MMTKMKRCFFCVCHKWKHIKQKSVFPETGIHYPPSRFSHFFGKDELKKPPVRFRLGYTFFFLASRGIVVFFFEKYVVIRSDNGFTFIQLDPWVINSFHQGGACLTVS